LIYARCACFSIEAFHRVPLEVFAEKLGAQQLMLLIKLPLRNVPRFGSQASLKTSGKRPRFISPLVQTVKWHEKAEFLYTYRLPNANNTQ
jgi:hypothetical protein